MPRILPYPIASAECAQRKATILMLLLTLAAHPAASVQESSMAATEQLTRGTSHAPVLMWTGATEPPEQESEEILAIFSDRDQNPKVGLEAWLKRNPGSAWAPSLHHFCAAYYREAGLTTKALRHWESGWDAVKADSTANGQAVGSMILIDWLSLLSSLGRLEELGPLIEAGKRWKFQEKWQRQRFVAAQNAYQLMRIKPEIAYRCGTLALRAVGTKLNGRSREMEALVSLPSPTNGFSVQELLDICTSNRLDLVAVRRTASDQEIVVPSVVHWRQNHYAAILEKRGDFYLVDDPTFGRPTMMQPADINEEASGAFLVPRNQWPGNWTRLSAKEASGIRGKGLPNNTRDEEDDGCTKSFSGQKECPPCPPGMPIWWVTEPYINLWMADEPVPYLTSKGELFSFRTLFNQRNQEPSVLWPFFSNRLPATGWDHNWHSYVTVASVTPNNVVPSTPMEPRVQGSYVSLHRPGGSVVSFPYGSAMPKYDEKTGIRLEYATAIASIFQSQSGVSMAYHGRCGLRVTYPDGVQEIYAVGILGDSGYGGKPKAQVFLTLRIAPDGGQTWFNYEHQSDNTYVLSTVVDPDGLTNSMSYVTNGTKRLLAEVENPYGRTATFQYDSDGNLTNLTDAQGLVSSVEYDQDDNPTRLITPYGTNDFEIIENTEAGQGNTGGHGLISRAIRITDTVGAPHLYLYRYDSSSPSLLPATISAAELPQGTPLGTLDDGTGDGSGGPNSLCRFQYRNSFYWSPRQYASLSTTNIYTFTTSDYLKGRLRHWLQDEDELYLTGLLSVERAPSPDGTTAGLMTFYDYAGKLFYHKEGTNSWPLVRAWRIPGGETHYEYLRRNSWGSVTNRVSTYTRTDGSIGTRTNIYQYAVNTYTNIVQQVEGETTWSPLQNTFEVPNLFELELGEDSAPIQWNGGFEIVSRTNYFDTGTSKSNRVVLTSSRVLPRYSTNAVDEVTERLYDPHDRLLGVQWPTGLTTTNLYNAEGFLWRSIDIESGRTNTFGHGELGLPTVHTNAFGAVTTLTWDSLLRLTSAADSRGYLSNRYDRLDLVAQRNRLGDWQYLGYDGNGRLVAHTNELEQVTRLAWCGCGTIEAITNALDEVTTFNYDQQSRLTSIFFSSTNAVFLDYDLAGRLTNVADSAGVSLQVEHNNQGLVTSLSGAYGDLYRAVYDTSDRPVWLKNSASVWTTNTYDGLNRVLTRSLAVGNPERFGYGPAGVLAYTNQIDEIVRLGYDAAYRLTRVTNANQEELQFGYDPDNNLIQLVDGKGQETTWRYDTFSRMTNKLDDLNAEMLRLAYDSNNRVTNRWTPAKGTTAIKWDAAGRLTNLVHPLSPSITAAYDALGRLTNLVDAAGTTAFAYSRMGDLASEDGPWVSDLLTLGYGNGGYLASASLTQPGTAAWVQTFLQDAAGRMTNTTSPAGEFGYHYLGASRLVQKLVLDSGGVITNSFDLVGRLTGTVLRNGGGTGLNSHTYGYNGAHQRTAQTNFFGNRWSYGYDGAGQLIWATGSESDGTPRLHEQLSYGYDEAWNLAGRTNNGFSQVFNVNSLNELTTSTRSSSMTVAGVTSVAATNVLVLGEEAEIYADNAFARAGVSLTDGYNVFAVSAWDESGRDAFDFKQLILPATVIFEYDANGNLTNDGRRVFYYDDDNQLINVTINGESKAEYVYDALGRRRVSRQYKWTGPAWSLTNETRFVYHGRRVMQERNASNVPQVTYTRGLDLSGTLEGAGGIGGLLARTVNPALPQASAHAYYHQDGRGNVTALINGSGVMVARYDYDPYGRTLGISGPLADANRYRFSSKEFDPGPDLYYYGFRFYDPNLQRWINEDPIGEAGGVNLYGYVGGDPINLVDPDGMFGKNFFRKLGQMLWGWMMGPDPGPPNPDLYGAQRSELLEGIDRDHNVLSDSIAEAVALAGDQATDALAGATAGKVLGGACKLRRAAPAAKTTAELTGEIHHGISKTVHKALEQHPNLKGLYKARDPRFVTQAKDAASHRGWPTWHRELDAEVSNWVRDRPNATPQQFENYLHKRYSQPDLQNRFPNGL